MDQFTLCSSSHNDNECIYSCASDLSFQYKNKYFQLVNMSISFILTAPILIQDLSIHYAGIVIVHVGVNDLVQRHRAATRSGHQQQGFASWVV